MPIYLDHNATTPPHPEVLDAMRAVAERAWANPSSVHRLGQTARAELDEARAAIARRLGFDARDVLLTSGGTEANNIALASLGQGGLVTSAVEHPSVLRTARRLGGAIAEVGQSGAVTVEAVEEAAASLHEVRLLSIQVANHETGVLQPIEALSAWAHARGALLHVDAVQAVGKIDPCWEGADLVTVAAHKIRGPKGIGALVHRPRIKLDALMAGGEQEKGLRPGTQSPALAAGFRVAIERIDPKRHARLARLRDDFERRMFHIGEQLGIQAHQNGTGARLPHVSNQSWIGWRGAELCAALDLEGIAISSGAACSAGTAEPSAVIDAMLGEARAASAIRISLGETTTAEDLRTTEAAFERVLRRNR